MKITLTSLLAMCYILLLPPVLCANDLSKFEFREFVSS